MKRLNTKRNLSDQIQNGEIVRKPLPCNTHPIRSYSDVVAFGNKDHSIVFSIPVHEMLTGNCPIEAFPPLTDIGNFSSHENDVVVLKDSRTSETLHEEAVTYGSYLETRFEACENDNIKIDVNLRSILQIKIDDFNFTEVDQNPESSSFPRFVRVFEDTNYLELEKKVLKGLKKLEVPNPF